MNDNLRGYTVASLEATGWIIFKCIAGSKAYGTSTPDSDTDIRGVYIQPLEDILGFGYVPQINDEANDVIYYELRRFLELLQQGSPNMVELLGMPEDVILIQKLAFTAILAHLNRFITKRLKDTMGGYARQQIVKARGQDKMMNWEKQKVERKTPLDFCYFTGHINGSLPLLDYLERLKAGDYDERYEFVDRTDLSPAKLVVVPLANMRDMYRLYEDTWSPTPRGLTQENSNALRVGSVPKEARPLGFLYYNQDGYSQHCKVYKQYQDWLLKRNDTRWVESQQHGQKINGKNMLHCKRILEMSRDIAAGKGIVVRRDNAEELLKVRRGEVNLQELLAWAEEEIKLVDQLFDQADFPEEVDNQFLDQLLTAIRKAYYNKPKR